ncbi:MAG: hypothetical protein AMXMBFR64_10500 [Myxococcales bacterium]
MTQDASLPTLGADTLGAADLAARPGTVPAHVGGRYVVGELLGAGSFGVVVRATDALSGRHLAVKLLRGLDDYTVARIRREVAALRLLRIPGVAELLDDGVDGERYYIAMELVEGTPFPGRAGQTPWGELAPIAHGLLETLARIHAAGIVHRDLKPGNILVTATGRPVVLDFGLAAGPAVGRTITQDGVVLGTPAYVSPEEVLGEAVGPTADLYAVGVMLFEALAGRRPASEASARDLLLERVARDAPPLRHVAPQVPPAVAEVVDALLARDPAQRPRTAHAVIEALFGRRLEGASLTLPWLGPRAAIDQAMALLRQGRAVRVTGSGGSGRTRVLREVVAQEEARGAQVWWASPAALPFASLEPLVPPEAAWSTLSVAEVAALVDERLARLLVAGVIAADDAERLDPWSRAALARAARSGPVLTTDPTVEAREVPVPPLAAGDLRALFHGPDRLLHLREDAAQELHQRTGGSPARVAAEVGAWVRAGLAAWEGELLRVDRPALDRLASGVRLVPAWGPVPVAPTEGELLRLDSRSPTRSHHRELLEWIHVAWPQARPDLLAAAMGEPRWRVEAELEELVALGLAIRAGDGAIALTAAASQSWQRWPEGRLRQAHGAMAQTLERGSAGRIRHLVAAGRLQEIVQEAAALARSHRSAGRLGLAAAALGEGLSAARAHDDMDGEALLLDAWTRLALADGSVRALDRALYELGRARCAGPSVAALEGLLRVSLRARREVGYATLRAVDALPPFEDHELEGARQDARIRASRAGDRHLEEAALRDGEAWARQTRTPDAALRAALWRGMDHYRRGRYDEAAACQLGPARGDGDALLRVGALLNAAAALLEAGSTGEALALAAEAGQLAAALRHAVFEGRSAWLYRTALYRQGLTSTVDLELLEATRAIGAPDLLAQVCATEAAVALRVGAGGAAASLAREADAIWTGMGRRWEPLLMRSLALAADGRPSPSEALDVEAAAACPVEGFGVQVLGLLAMARGAAQPAWSDVARRLAALTAPNRRTMRLDVLSVEEALAAVGLRRPE